MAIAEQPVVPAQEYTHIFQDYLGRSIAHLTKTVRASAVLTPEERGQALHTLQYALNVTTAWPVARELLLEVAPKIEQAGYRDEWLPYLEKGIARSASEGDTRAQAELHLQLGLIYLLGAHYDQAEQSFWVSTAIFEELGDRHNQAKSLNRRAYIARLQRRPAEAYQQVNAAVALLAPDDVERGFSHFVLGTLAFDEKRWADAVQSFTASLKLWEQEGDKRKIALGLRNLGPALRAQQRYDEAIVCYQQAITLLAEVGDPVEGAITQMNLGTFYLFVKEPEKALYQYQIAEPLLRNAHDELHLTMLYTNQGIALRELERWSQAEQTLLTAVERWRQLGNHEWEAEILDDLGVVYLNQRLYLKAIATFEAALSCLHQIKIEPDYNALYKVITQHLQQAQNLIK